MRLPFICILIFTLLISCKKEGFNPNPYYTCHKTQNLDSAAIFSKLVGTWKWTLLHCSFREKTAYADKKVIVEFKSDSSFSVMENQSVITQGKWNLVPEDGDWAVNASSMTEYLDGKILFCGDEVLFYASYMDLCDHLYRRN